MREMGWGQGHVTLMSPLAATSPSVPVTCGNSAALKYIQDGSVIRC